MTAVDVIGGPTIGGIFFPSDFGAVGIYDDVRGPSVSLSLTVSAISAAPEPGAVTLLALGVAGLGKVRRVRRCVADQRSFLAISWNIASAASPRRWVRQAGFIVSAFGAAV